jgi:hypothetical protein
MPVAVHALPAPAVEREQLQPLLQRGRSGVTSEHAGLEVVVARVEALLIAEFEVRALVSGRVEPAVERAVAGPPFLRGAVEQACRREDFRRLFRPVAGLRPCRRVCLARQQFH